MTTEGKLRIFSPVILFHDHHFTKDDEHVAYTDPFHHDGQTIESHKRRISRMLENNGRFWSDIITWSRDHAPMEHSPVPSLVSSPTPPLQPQELPSPRQSPPLSSTSSYHHLHHQQQQKQQHHNSKASNRRQSSTAGTVLVATTATTATTVSSTGKTNKRRRGNLPKAVTAILRDWLSDHKKHPYPTEDEKDILAKRTGLTLNQISNWFINARRRILQPMLEQEEQQQHELDILPYESPQGHHQPNHHHHHHHNHNHHNHHNHPRRQEHPYLTSSSDDHFDQRLGKRSTSEASHRRDPPIQKKFNTRRRS